MYKYTMNLSVKVNSYFDEKLNFINLTDGLRGSVLFLWASDFGKFTDEALMD